MTLARAEEEAARILARVHQRADEVRGQIRELVSMRDHLRATTQEIIVTYGQALSALDQRFDDALAAVDGDADRRPGESASAGQRRFVGDVRVVAGPLRDLDGIRILEEALMRIDAVEHLALTGFADHNVQIELRLSVECDLLTELQRALPFAFEVEAMAGADLGLRLSAG